MNCGEIIEQYLRRNKYDGLAGEGCGCIVGDLVPCGSDPSYCEPGIKTDPPEDDPEEYEFYITPVTRPPEVPE